MRKKYIFSNIIGTFVFNEHFRPIKSIMVKNIKDYFNQGFYEKEFFDKYKELTVPDDAELKKILAFFRKKEYLDKFYSGNLKLTKKLVKESVKPDLLIIQAVNNIGDIDKSINTLSKRLREWYELYNPEFSHSIEKHEKFVELILKKSKKELLKEVKVTESMGADLPKEDLMPIMELASKIQELFMLREKQEKYLEKSMKKLCPNMLAITGVMIGAKLLAQAGSLKKLALFPASTVQLLGAEKALFRHLKTKSRSPKYGYIHEHPLIAKNKKSIHGKIARALADKIAIAVKVDYFKGKFIGDKLKSMLDKKFGK